jgi:uncharacterized protein (DUF779 family)
VLLGRVGETPVYIDGDQDRRWREPALVIDVAPGPAMGFSLEGALSVHLVALSDQCFAAADRSVYPLVDTRPTGLA